MESVVYTASSLEPTRENKKIYSAIFARINTLQPSRVLELGAGMGMLGHMLYEAGIDYTGIEPDQGQLDLCRQRYPRLNIIEGSVYEPPENYALGQFDLVFSTDVIEHLYLPRCLLAFKKASLRPGGHALTCTPDFGSYWKNILYSITNKWDTVHSPHWDGGHIKFFSRKSLQSLLAEQGFVEFQWETITNVNIPILPMSILCVCRLPNTT